VDLDKNPANTSGLEAINRGLDYENKISIRKVKYLNNMIEQDHRFIKQIVRPMKGFKSFYGASATLTGIELCHMIRKEKFKNCSTEPSFKEFYKLAA
jgi:putative transposase